MSTPPSARSAPARVVRVLPDVSPIAREFDYLVPDALDASVKVGTRVRISLHGRRVGGWVVADRVSPPAGVALRPLSGVTGWGPTAELVELATWASWRWAGPRAALVRAASPGGAVRHLPPAASRNTGSDGSDGPTAGSHGPARVGGAAIAAADHRSAGTSQSGGLPAEALAAGRAILRLPPAADPLAVVQAAAARGPALVVAPTHDQASALGRRLRAEGRSVALVPGEWAQAAAGVSVVLGARGSAWAPCPGLAALVVLDGHDEALHQEQTPTWNAWVVAAERARRARVPCVVVSPCPTLDLLAWPGARLVIPSRSEERAGWAPLEVVDLGREDPRVGLYSPRVVGVLRGKGRVLCVLNRKGRARLLACAACGAISRCERCGAAVGLVEEAMSCARCATSRPQVCQACGSIKLKTLRVGVSRARDELEHLADRPVGEVTAQTGDLGAEPILVGTEAVLRRADQADAVVFLDFDQELLAPRYRAAEEALALLALASRLVGGRSRAGRVVVQTHLPQHDVVQAALTADPARLADREAAMRADLGLPPSTALAVVSGAGAQDFVSSLPAAAVDVLGPTKGRYVVKAATHRALSDALAAATRPPGQRLRVEVDPLRL